MERPPLPSNLPYAFVVEALESLDPVIGRMFGCFSIYVGHKIVLILRERDSAAEDNGIWVATTTEHHETLRKEMPSLRDIGLFGPGPTGWQCIPAESDDFERDAARVCDLVCRGDQRIGKIPAKKKGKSKQSTKKTEKKRVARVAAKSQSSAQEKPRKARSKPNRRLRKVKRSARKRSR